MTGEPEGSRDSRHRSCDEMVQVGIGRTLLLEVALEDVVELLVVGSEDEVCMVDELIERKDCVVSAKERRRSQQF